ncbi:NUDIX domain-containing protein [Microbacterium sp. NPDC055910]|uniref:NUDIX hydrolase n=1 Tax=Microbacterium sp. NPDC055910 TaxID=3345659 RepID=UPI0035E1BC28
MTRHDEAARVISDAVDGARPRRPADADDPDIPVAATVVVVRDGTDGAEVLVIQRPDRGSFAGAWVFPGGKLDDADRESADEPEEAVVRRAAVRETWEETGLTLAPDSLVPLSIWDPPPGIPLRIRTWFFVAAASGVDLVLSEHEAVAAEWVRPGRLLERHARGEATLYPPTWVTLHGFEHEVSAEGALGAARLGGLRRFDSVARTGPNGPFMLWPEDAEFDPDAPRAGTARHRLEVGALPWTYIRTD